MKQALESKIVMVRPNEVIEIFNGIIEINEISLLGKVYHQWFPFDQIKLSIKNFTGEISNLNGSITEVKFENNKGNFLITSIQEEETINVSAILISKLIKKDEHSDGSIKSIDFNLVNFRPYFGKVFEFLPKSRITGELEFLSIECDLVVQSRFKSDDSKKLLTEYGGFLITNNGRINFKNCISSERLDFYIRRLSTFVSFLNGRRCGPRFIKALNSENKVVINDYTPYLCDQYKYVQSWMPFKLDNDFFKLWSSFLQLTKNEDDFERIDLIIHWYLEALNNSGFVNGSIILLQNSFETLFSWLVTEKKYVSQLGENRASDKIRSLFIHYEIPLIFPSE